MNKLISLGLLLGFAVNAQAAQPSSPAQLATCSGCHGAQGEGNSALMAPRLAGQDAQYLARQLRSFKVGKRAYDQHDLAGARMRMQAFSLSDSDITQLADYYAVQQLPVTTAAVGADEHSGNALYGSTCAACHGPNAQGYPQLSAPNLRILSGEYLSKQLSSFVHGWRGSEPHSDIQGLWMRAIALQIPDPSAEQSIVDYIGSLPVSE